MAGVRVIRLVGIGIAVIAPLCLAQVPESLVHSSATVVHVAFSPDGTSLIAVLHDGTINIWNLKTNKSTTIIPPKCCLLLSNTEVAISSETNVVALVSYKDIILLDVNTGKVLHTFTTTTSVTAVAFSPDGRVLASGLWNGNIVLWDTETGKLLETLKGHVDAVRSIAFTFNGRLLASGSEDKTIKLWDMATRAELHTLSAHTGWIYSLAFSPEGDTLASGSSDATIILWDMPTGRKISVLKGHHSWITSLQFSPDGKLLASGSLDHTIILWDASTGQKIHQLSGNTGGINSVVFNADGTLLASSANSDGIRLWDIRAILHPNQRPVAGFSWRGFLPEANTALTMVHSGKHVRFDASTSEDPDGEIAKYEWDWESDSRFDLTTTHPVVEHVFDQPGTYQVTLRVTDDRGATATVTKTVTVVERKPPQADFTFSPAFSTVLDTVRFTDRSHDPDGEVVSWQWDFGDGTTSTGRNPTHRYTKKGSFTVKLTVTDDDGLTATVEKEITVVNTPPVAEFTVPDGIYTNFAALFDASVSYDPDGEIVRYQWDFDGDEVVDAEGQEVEWTFTEEGTYTVVLIVTDDDGATARKEVEIEVVVGGGGGPL